MGRSFYRLSPETVVEGFARKNSLYHAPSDSYFSVVQRGGRYFQVRYQIDPTGRRVNEMEMSIDYVMGSGNHARAYLHRLESGRLVELPIGWYAEKGGYWGMNPGYDRPDHDGFRRPITYECMFCHNAYPKIPPGHERPFSEAVYEGELPVGIDCERCHGDGVEHVKLAGAAGAGAVAIRRAIVNPKRLSPNRQMDLCMSCHLETTSFPLPNALQRYERGPFSFRAGEKLEDFLLNFDHAPEAGRQDKFEIVSAAYRLRQSACFLKSGGQLTCVTCHSPHRQETRAGYNSTCRSCHGASGHVTAQADCVNCHMPKRRTEDVIHASVTDHLVAARMPAAGRLAERRENRDAYQGPVVPYYPSKLTGAEGGLYLAVAQVKQGSNRKQGLIDLGELLAQHRPARAEWYLEMAEALETDGQLERSASFYREAVSRDPSSGYMQQRLGTALRKLGRGAEAIPALRRSVQLEPERAMNWHELGMVYRSLNRNDDAIAALTKAVSLDPLLAEGFNNLGVLRLSEADLREAIRIKPDYADAHSNLAGLLGQSGRGEEARTEYEAALRWKPGDARTRFAYALLLGQTGRYDEARRELERVVETDPAFGEARETLGDVWMGVGDTQRAMVQYREAARLQPGSARAHFGLGAALAKMGDRTAAAEHLRRSAEDPAWKDKSEELLRQLENPVQR